jgi:hypothetical protein
MNEKYSFRRGFGLAKHQDIPTIKREIMATLGISTRGAWLGRLNGKVEPKISEAEAIVTIFAKHGVTEVWGN